MDKGKNRSLVHLDSNSLVQYMINMRLVVGMGRSFVVLEERCILDRMMLLQHNNHSHLSMENKDNRHLVLDQLYSQMVVGMDRNR